MFRKLAPLAVAAILAAISPRPAHAWSHQGHILITRIACLRIINDPAAPPGLKAFLKTNMKYDQAACQKLAEEEFVGADAKNYLTGIDGTCTLPDRIQQMDEGDTPVAPYGVLESKVHFLDMEYFAKDPVFKPDLSSRPAIKDFPHDAKDPRYKAAGFVPFRVEEFYGKLVQDFGKRKEMNNDLALHDLGYLVHYIEDCHQPQHATVDYKSFSYLAGKVKAVHATTRKAADGSEYTTYQVSGNAKINPHGDVEYQLFENTDEPRKALRKEYWKELTAQIDQQAKDNEALSAIAAEGIQLADEKVGGFKYALRILSASYECLPAIGQAAQAAYPNDTFDPQLFFTHEGTVAGKKMTTLALIARQNAAAVLAAEAAIRQAWAEAP